MMPNQPPMQPPTGQPLPPGALPGEKSDDIEAKLSDGEFVIPAEIVRYYGVRTFEGMIKEASANLGNMQKQGRIKGDEGPPQAMPGAPAFATGGLAQSGNVRRVQLPDGRVVFKYVDAQGNPVGDMGSNIIGGPTVRTWKAPGEDDEQSKKDEEKKPEPDKVEQYEHGHGDGSGGHSPDDGGPNGKGFSSFSDFADAATSQLSSVASQFSNDVSQAMGNLGRDLGLDNVGASTDTSTSATGPDHGESDAPGSTGPGPGSSDTEGSPAGDGGGTAGGASAGTDGEGSGTGADGSGAENYANGGLVLRPKKVTGGKAPGLDR